MRGSFRFIKDREDNISNNVFAPGIGWRTTPCRATSSTGSSTQVLELVDGQRDDGRLRAQQLRVLDRPRASTPKTTARLVPVGARRRSAAPRAVRRVPRSARASATTRRTSIRTCRSCASAAASRAGLLGSYNPGRRVGGGWTLPAANRNHRWSFQDDLSWTRGPAQLQVRVLDEWASKTEPLSPNYRGNYNFGHNAENPLSTGNGYANALLGVVHHLHRADQPRRPRPAALADGRATCRTAGA